MPISSQPHTTDNERRDMAVDQAWNGRRSGEAGAPVWSRAAVEELFELPFIDLVHRAQAAHRRHFDPNAVQLST